MQPFVPGRPLNRGEYESRVGLSFSSSDISRISLQGGIYWGLSNQDVFGLSFNNFIIPSHITYARYLKKDFNSSWNGNFQFHLGNILLNEYNPNYEIDFATTRNYSNKIHSLKIGVGYYGKSILDFINGYKKTPIKIVPIMGYQFQSSSFQAEAEVVFGLSDYHVFLFKIGREPDSTYGTIIKHDDIKNVIQNGNEFQNATWKIYLQSGDSLMIMNRAPYADCIRCGERKSNLESYLPSGEYRTLWIYGNNVEVMLLDLNMKSILEKYYNGGNLEILEEMNIVLKKQKVARTGYDDIGLSIGYRKRQK